MSDVSVSPVPRPAPRPKPILTDSESAEPSAAHDEAHEEVNNESTAQTTPSESRTDSTDRITSGGSVPALTPIFTDVRAEVREEINSTIETTDNSNTNDSVLRSDSATDSNTHDKVDLHTNNTNQDAAEDQRTQEPETSGVYTYDTHKLNVIEDSHATVETDDSGAVLFSNSKDDTNANSETHPKESGDIVSSPTPTSPQLVIHTSPTPSDRDADADTSPGNRKLRTAHSLHAMTIESDLVTVDSPSDDIVNADQKQLRGSASGKPTHLRSSSYAALTVHAAKSHNTSQRTGRNLSSPSTESATSEGHAGMSPHRKARLNKMKQKSKTTLSWSGFNETITDNDLNVDLTVRTPTATAPRKTTPSPTKLETVEDDGESPSEAFEHTGVLIRCELEEMDLSTLTVLHDNLQNSLAALNKELVHVLNVRDETVAEHEQKEEEMAKAMNSINDLSDTKSFEALAGNERLKPAKSSAKKKK